MRFAASVKSPHRHRGGIKRGASASRNLGTIENIAAAKAELIEGLKPGGIAVLNADDQLVLAMRAKHSGRVVSFGIDHDAEVTAREINTGALGQYAFPANPVRRSCC